MAEQPEKENLTCASCGELLVITYKYCPFCGTECNDERTIISYYFRKGFTYKAIVRFLEKEHGINMSERTLRNRLADYSLKRRLAEYDVAFVRERIEAELNGPGCMGGYRSVWHTLRMEGVQVPRNVVEGIVKELDPEGCELRRAHRLRRRQYVSLGPNHHWHTDGYDKLKPYGFPIHGCIDGWSRKLLWFKLARSNNNPKIPAMLYLEVVAEQGGCARKLRSDCGTENCLMATIQCELCGEPDAHIYGPSPANQRIESWWSFYRRNRSTWWINYFKDLVEKELFSPSNVLEKECIWFCFSAILQKDLDTVKEHWNSHFIRRSRHDTVSGRPDELYLIPECHGGEEDLLVNVTNDKINEMRHHVMDIDGEANIYQDYFQYIVDNSNIQMPSSWMEAQALYCHLIEIARGE